MKPRKELYRSVVKGIESDGAKLSAGGEKIAQVIAVAEIRVRAVVGGC